jgi:SAM-dependent MidA family methyltransferase
MPVMSDKQPVSVSATPGPQAPAAGLGGRASGATALTAPPAQAEPLAALIREQVAAAGGWLPFDRFVHLALYAPGLGYYARGALQLGAWPASGSDFITAPELSPLFGRALARQVLEGLDAAQAEEIWEFGAGTGALAQQLLETLGDRVRRYTIVEVSAGLQARQRERLAAWGDRVAWAQALPPQISGVVVGNEVLDAMPVRLLAFDGQAWHERGVVWPAGGGPSFEDRPTTETPPWPGPFVPGTVTERHDQAQAFVRTLADHLVRGLVLLIDYGFPQAEYYHPQRTGGTLMCHQAHRSDANPLADIGDKDITAHVDFTGIALAAQDAGLDVLGYTSQARFLLNCGLAEQLASAGLRERAAAQKLITEHEMGELFKVLALGRGLSLDPLGFAQGDRMHRL